MFDNLFFFMEPLYAAATVVTALLIVALPALATTTPCPLRPLAGR